MIQPAFIQSIQKLFAILEQRKIEHVIVGGIAIFHYITERNTQDLDLLIPPIALEQLSELQILHQDNHFVRANYEKLQIDLLFTHNPLFQKVQTQYSITQSFFDHHVRLATVEGLLLLKLYALPSLYKQRHFSRVGFYENDIGTLIYNHPVNMPALLTELTSYVNEDDLAKIKAILSDIRHRLKHLPPNPRLIQPSAKP